MITNNCISLKNWLAELLDMTAEDVQMMKEKLGLKA